MNFLSPKVRRFLVSLRVTVALLILGMILIFWATLAQVELGVWGVQERFFHCWIVTERIPGTALFAPFPGGYMIGFALLINLVAAHIDRFKFTTKKLGIQLTHIGVIMLLVGELFTGLWQESFSMRITEGQTLNYAEHSRHFELAVIDVTDPEFDDVVAIPSGLLAAGETVQHPKLPFRVTSKGYYPNSQLIRRDASTASAPPSPADKGVGPQVVVTPVPVTYKDNEANFPSAYIEFIAASGSLGTWLVSPDLENNQSFTHEGRTFKIVMRPERSYKPFSLSLSEVRHDVYPGTSIPKNYSSRITLKDGSESREVLIYMNNPLRYGGLTFYQHQMDAGTKTTGLQVVRNPSWQLPYVACIVMTIGLIQQFGAHLLAFIRKRRTPAAA